MGRIIVMSAGNDGQEKIHLSKTFTPQDSLLHTFLDFTPANYKRTWIDIWGDSAKTFCANVSLFSGGTELKSTGFFCVDGEIHNTVLTNDVSQDSCTVQFITSLAEYNGRPRLTINLFNKTLDSVLVTVKAQDGKLHLWNEYYYYGYTNSYLCDFESYGYPWAEAGNTETTVSDMGSSGSVLLVGAYVSKIGWRDVNSNSWSYSSETIGKIASFSSRGPLANGTIKPDITAPGLTMGTATNSFNSKYTPTGASSSYLVAAYTEPVTNKKYYYSEFTGTSASAPVTSGVVALMLEANPTMSPAQVKRILQQTAIKDTHTGALPPQGDNTWGPGKINAYAAVKLATQETGLYSFSGIKLDCALFPNPNNGRFTLDYTTAQREELLVEIYDLKGMLVYRTNWGVENGNNTKDIDLSSREKGLYFIKVSSGEGTVVMRTVVSE
jgi:minor extracellular serine protease Vpr